METNTLIGVFMIVLVVFLASLMFIGFAVRMSDHERKAYHFFKRKKKKSRKRRSHQRPGNGIWTGPPAKKKKQSKGLSNIVKTNIDN